MNCHILSLADHDWPVRVLSVRSAFSAPA